MTSSTSERLNLTPGAWLRWRWMAPAYGLVVGLVALIIYWPGCLSFLPGMSSFAGTKPLRVFDLHVGDVIQRHFVSHGAAPAAPKICIVGVTEEEIANRPLPWPRKMYGDLARVMHDGGAKVIAFNMYFSDERLDDASFANDIRYAGNVVLPRCGILPELAAGTVGSVRGPHLRAQANGQGLLRFTDGAYRAPFFPTSRVIYDAASAKAHLNIFYDEDLVAGRGPRANGPAGGASGDLPLGVTAALMAEGYDPAAAQVTPKSITCGQVRIPLDDSGSISVSYLPVGKLVDFRPYDVSRLEGELALAPTAPIQFFAYSDVQERRVPKSAFKDAIVFVGPWLAGSREDLHLTPEGNEYGVLIQATLADSVLSRRFLAPVGAGWTVLSMLLLSVLLGAGCFSLRLQGNSYVTVLGGLMIFVVCMLLLGGIAALLREGGLMLDVSPFLLVVGLNLSSGVIVSAARAARDAHRRDMEMDLLLMAGRRQVTDMPDQETPRTAAIPGASQMAISASLSLRSPEIVAETFYQTIPCEGTVLFSIPEGAALSFDRSVMHAFGDAFPRDEIHRIAVRFAWETLKQGRAIIRSRRQRSWMFPETNPIFQNLLGVPIVARGQPLAIAVLFNKRATPASPEREFQEDHLRLVSALRYQAAALLENARRYQLEYAMFDGFARSLAKAVDFRDNYTRGHSERVAELSSGLARELGLSEEEVEIVQRAATLHDLGKIGVNDMVLRKPGMLSDSEFALIRAHAANGYEILKAAPSFEALLPGIRHHHERYDGSGYPDGLAGNEIPLIARIIAAADAYDAMTSNRPYRKALPESKAREELRAGSGTQFDPQIIEGLLSYLNKRGMDDSAEVTQTAMALSAIDADKMDETRRPPVSAPPPH